MKYPIIRTIYLYLFALVGLVMLTIGAVQLVQLGLKTWVFPQADAPLRYPTPLPITGKPGGLTQQEFAEAIKACQKNCQLTKAQQEFLAGWQKDYQEFKARQEEFPQINRTQDRQRQATNALGFILVGLPLYWYHWRVIKKDIKTRR